MKKLMIATIGAGMLMLSPVAQANTIDATNPKKIADLVGEWATDVKVDKDSQGDPRITFKHDDYKQAIYFYGCDKGKNCKSIQFAISWNNDGRHTLKTINEWNSTKRFAKAYLDDENDPVLEMDIDLEEKVSPAYLREAMSTWRTTVLAFELGL